MPLAYAELAKTDVPTSRGIPRSAQSVFARFPAEVVPPVWGDLDRFESCRPRANVSHWLVKDQSQGAGRRHTESVEVCVCRRHLRLFPTLAIRLLNNQTEKQGANE